jgi:pentatricopeptide repeat protein
VPSFLGFEARLVPGHVGGLGFGLGRGNGGGLGFGGDAGGNKRGEAFPAVEEKEQLAPVEKAAQVAHGMEPAVPTALEQVTAPLAKEEAAPTSSIKEAEAAPIVEEALSTLVVEEKDAPASAVEEEAPPAGVIEEAVPPAPIVGEQTPAVVVKAAPEEERAAEIGGEAADAAKDTSEDVKEACEEKAKRKVHGGCSEICGRMSVSGSLFPRVQFHGGLVELGRDALWRSEWSKLANIMVSALGRLRKVEIALDVFDKAQKAGFGNNVYAYAAMVSAYGR